MRLNFGISFQIVRCFIFACLALSNLNSGLAQQPAYRPESSQKVQLEDIEQDNLKSVQQSTNQIQSVPQYTSQYPTQQNAAQIVYSLPTQQSQHVPTGQTTNQAAASYPLYTIPAQPSATLPGQQHYIYYSQPQQLSPYDVPFFGSAYSFVPQSAQSVLPTNVNVNDLYKTLQPQTTSTSAKAATAVKTAAPQIPASYYFSPIPQTTYYSPVHLPQVPVSNTPQYVAYNSFYPVQTAQKSVYSAGVKSTTAAPVKNTESNYRFDYNSPDFAKLRVTG